MKLRAIQSIVALVAVLLVSAASSTAWGGRPARSVQRVMPPRSPISPKAPRAELPAPKGNPIKNVSLRPTHPEFEASLFKRLGKPDPLIVDQQVLKGSPSLLNKLARRTNPSPRRQVEVAPTFVKARLVQPEREVILRLEIPRGSTIKGEAAQLRQDLRRLPSVMEGSTARPKAIIRQDAGYVLEVTDGFIPLWLPKPTMRDDDKLATVDFIEA